MSWTRMDGRVELEGPAGLGDQGAFPCSTEKRFAVVIFSAGLTEKTTSGARRLVLHVARLLAAEALTGRAVITA